jgi:hypothetical protein
MNWIRSKTRFGARLALFALALQSYLSFAHVHADDIYGPVGQALTVAETVNLPAAESFNSIPADQPWYGGDALCPICETVYFLSICFTPDVADVLPLTFSSRPAEHSDIRTTLFIASQRAPFQSRGPPIA